MGIKNKVHKMKLTKDQRHTAYIIMLAEAKYRLKILCQDGVGLCNLFYDIFGLFPREETFDRDRYAWDDVCITEVITEYHNKRPESYKMFFFSTDKKGWKKRISLLEQCINETA